MSRIAAQLLFHSTPLESGALKRMIDAASARRSRPWITPCFSQPCDAKTPTLESWQVEFVGLSNCSVARISGGSGNGQSLVGLATNYCCISFDGRIDNRDELLERLSQVGLPQPTELNDAQLVLAGYRAWGTGVFPLLLGEFALALWDGPHRRLVCARDPMGLRPLFYHYNHRRFICGSAIRQLFADPETPRELSDVAIADYLTGVSPDPEGTFYKGVQRVPAGHWLEVRCDGTVRTVRYWDPRAIPLLEGKPATWYAEEFRDRFLQAVRARLRSTSHKVAVHVSGGFDSAAVTAAVHYWNAQAKLGIDTCAFVNVARHPAADERRYVEQVLARFPMPVETTSSEDYWAFRPVPLLEQWQDEPNTAPYAARLVAELKAARHRGIDVILGGSGGDEIGGSSWYLVDLLLQGRFWRFWPELSARARSKTQARTALLLALLRLQAKWLRGAFGRERSRPPPWMNLDLARRLQLHRPLHKPPVHKNPARDDIFHRLRYCWTEPLLSSGRELYDYFGVEIRLPFLDRRVVEWALAVPPFRFGEDGLLKMPLRRALAELVPPAITERASKADYLHYWDLGLRTQERDRVLGMLDSSVAADRGYIDAEKLRAAYERYCRGEEINRRQLWHALTLEAWLSAATKNDKTPS